MAVLIVKEGRRRLLQAIDNNISFHCLLWKNDITPDLDTEYADLTLCDFSGYATVETTFGAITINDDDNAEFTGSLCQFIHDGGATSNDVYGWCIIGDPGTPIILAIERFSDAPRSMAIEDDEIDVTPRLTQGGCP